MALVAEGSLLASFFFSNINVDQRGIANITVSEYTEIYRQDENYQMEFVSTYEYVSPNCYDSMWAIALALNCTDTALKESGKEILTYQTGFILRHRVKSIYRSPIS